MRKRWLYCLILGWLATACSEQDDPEVAVPWRTPSGFPDPTYTFDNNPLSAPGVELGRRLFYDPILSRDSTVSCASCHRQHAAFADPLHRLSVGVNDREGVRNAPGIFNLAFKQHFFWDGGARHIDFVPLNAIENPLEMDNDLDQVLARLNRHGQYPRLFRQAFGQDSIGSQAFLHALAQFTVQLVSDDSPYDQYIRGETDLSEAALRGQTLFEQHCASCHPPPLFTDEQFRNNGLDRESTQDQGRAIITEVAEDRGKFKVPSLRNVALTAPYMHNGRFRTLEEVLTHYRRGVQASATLDPILSEPGIALTVTASADIITFLKTLTDSTFITNPQFANPFR